MANIVHNYNYMSVPERMGFMSVDFFTQIQRADVQQLNGFLLGIISDQKENSYVKGLAIDRLMDLVFLGTIKCRQALSILIDNWSLDEVHLNVKRIKSLYFLYEHSSQEIETLLIQYLSNDEAELSAEASFHLGLINMQKGLLSLDQSTSIYSLEKSKAEFLSASQIIENRVDANIFSKIISLTLDILKNVTDSLVNGLKEIGDLLFKIEGFSFNFRNGPFYTGFYRVLQGLANISVQNPRSWLDYRLELSNLFQQYALIQNQEIKDRLQLSSLSGSFLEKLNTAFFDPFFTLNFSADKSRISSRLIEVDQNSPEAIFLNKLLALSGDEVKKKADNEALKKELMKLFSPVGEDTINSLLLQFSDLDIQARLFKVFEILSKPSAVQLDDVIIRCCLMLQSMRSYYGNCLEDDRNTIIANLLESAGYLLKDQTRRSITQTGKSAGEIDVFIEDINHNPISIIEALNLSSVDKSYIELHIDKIFTYDANGLKDNYVIVYSTAANFGSFYNRYRDFVKSHIFKYPLKSLKENTQLPYAELKSFTVVHERNSMEINMHHIVINLLFN